MIASKRIKILQDEIRSLVADVNNQLSTYAFHCDLCKKDSVETVQLLTKMAEGAAKAFEVDNSLFAPALQDMERSRKTLEFFGKLMKQPSTQHFNASEELGIKKKDEDLLN